MDRRKIIRFALGSGPAIVAVRLASSPCEAGAGTQAAPKVEFQKGTLRGGKFEGWGALLASTGKAVRGTIYDPNSLGGARITGYRVRGVARAATLDLDFYDLEDVAFEKPVGGGKGKEKKGKTTTRFEVDQGPLAGKQSGSMATKPVPVSGRQMREIAGEYFVSATDRLTGDVMGEFTLKADAGGAFTLNTLFVSNSTTAVAPITGRLAVARDGTIYTTSLLPKGEAFDFDASEVNIFAPAKDEKSIVEGGPDDILHSILFLFCILLHCRSEAAPAGISGRVTDKVTGQGIMGVLVAAGNINLATDGVGHYLLRVPQGHYTVFTSRKGYVPKTIENVVVEGPNGTILNIELEPA